MKMQLPTACEARLLRQWGIPWRSLEYPSSGLGEVVLGEAVGRGQVGGLTTR